MLASYPLKNGSSPVLATDSDALSYSARIGSCPVLAVDSGDLSCSARTDSGAPSCWARIGAAASTSSGAAGAAASAPPRTRNSPRKCSRTPGRRPERRWFSVKFQAHCKIFSMFYRTKFKKLQ